MVYFSGITLAILDIEQRTRLLNILQTARANGKMIAFDPNLQPRLWRYTRNDQSNYARRRSRDLVMPSFEDEADWFNDASLKTRQNDTLMLAPKPLLSKMGALLFISELLKASVKYQQRSSRKLWTQRQRVTVLTQK